MTTDEVSVALTVAGTWQYEDTPGTAALELELLALADRMAETYTAETLQEALAVAYRIDPDDAPEYFIPPMAIAVLTEALHGRAKAN